MEQCSRCGNYPCGCKAEDDSHRLADGHKSQDGKALTSEEIAQLTKTDQGSAQRISEVIQGSSKVPQKDKTTEKILIRRRVITRKKNAIENIPDGYEKCPSCGNGWNYAPEDCERCKGEGISLKWRDCNVCNRSIRYDESMFCNNPHCVYENIDANWFCKDCYLNEKNHQLEIGKQNPPWCDSCL